MLIIIAALIAQNISPIQGKECYNKTIEDSVTEFHNELRRDFATKNINQRYGNIPGSKSLFKLALIAQNISPTQGEECYNKTIEDSVTEFHNELRRDFATKNINQRYGDIPGSKSLFKLQYDCGLAALARALIPKDCSKQALDLSPFGVSSNFRKFRTIREIVGDDIIEYYNVAVEEWATKNIVPLESDVIYKDKNMEAFANMIYYKSIAFGCTHKNCINDYNATSFAIACVTDQPQKLVSRSIYRIRNRKIRKAARHIRLAENLYLAADA